MEFNEERELILDQDAEVNAVNFLANYVTTRKVREEHIRQAEELSGRISEIIMGKPEGNFDKPSVGLSLTETRLVLAAAYNFVYGFEDNYNQLFPNVKQKIDELAQAGEQYFNQ